MLRQSLKEGRRLPGQQFRLGRVRSRVKSLDPVLSQPRYSFLDVDSLSPNDIRDTVIDTDKLHPSETKGSEAADADAADDVCAFPCADWRPDLGPNSWSRSRWLKGYQQYTDGRSSIMSSGDYLHMPNVAADRREADYSETVPKTAAFGDVSEYQPTTSYDDVTPSYATISRSTRPAAGNRAPATAAATTSTSPSAVPPPLPSPPRTLRSDSDANEPGYVQLDFRSTNQSNRDARDDERDHNNNDVCRRCRQPLQPDDRTYMTVILANHSNRYC